MNSQEQLLLLDTPPASPLRSKQKISEENLLLDLNQPENSTTDNTLYIYQKPPKLLQQTWSNTRSWKEETRFFWEEESEEQEEAQSQLTDEKGPQEYYSIESKKLNFPYENLMKKLGKALEIIEEKEKMKTFSLFASVKHEKSLSSYDKQTPRQLKTHRNSKEDNEEQIKRKQKWKKMSEKRKSATEPDQRSNLENRSKVKPLMKQSFIDCRVMDQIEQNPKGKKGQKLRSKQQFLASITNWQERKKIKHQERIQKQQAQSMNGVTFTPQINAKSKLLMKKKGNVLPIYERQTKVRKIQNEVPKHAIKQKK